MPYKGTPRENQSINVSVTDEDHKQLDTVNCSLIDSIGADYHPASAPGTVVVSKGRGPIQVCCKEPGYKPYSGAINSNFNPVTLLDILFWPTFIVDFATGAAQKYPSHYNVVMSEKT